MIHFLTYSNDNMTISRGRCADSARKFGANMVYEFEPMHISDDFYATNQTILDTKFCESGTRPCDGFWLWKPYFINRIMMGAKDGDIVCYTDAGCEVIADLNHIVNAMDQDVFLS